MEQFTCTDYVDFRKCQNRYEPFSWSKTDSNYLDIKMKVFKKSDNKQYPLVQKLTKEESDSNQFKRLGSQSALAAKIFAGELVLPALAKPTTPKDMDEQLKLAHSLFEGRQCIACHVFEKPFKDQKPLKDES